MAPETGVFSGPAGGYHATTPMDVADQTLTDPLPIGVADRRSGARSRGGRSRPASTTQRGPRVKQPTRRAASADPTARQPAVLADLGRRALSDDVQTLMEAAAGQAVDVLHVQRCCIAEVEPGDERLKLIAEAGRGGHAVCPRSAWIPVGAMLARHAIGTRETVVSGDGAAAVVIVGSDRTLGAIFVGADRPELEPSAPTFLRGIAATIALAIERALAQQRLAAARELERRRVARDFHDDGLRELTKALGIATRGLLGATEPPDRRLWEQQTVALQRLTRHLRAAIYDLRRGEGDDRGFADLLSQLVAVEAELTEGRRVEFHGRDALPAGSLGQRGSEALAIVREAVTNARRHSGARGITVDAAASTSDCLRIDITDDGSWPQRGVACTRRGSGILGMHERADKLRATLRVEPRPDGGTRVSLRVPLGVPAFR